VISPLLANIVLNHLDWTLEEKGLKFVRYADDFVILTRTSKQAEEALEIARRCIEEDLGLNLNLEKTKITTYRKGFQFLGFSISSCGIDMSPKSEDRFKTKIKNETIRCRNLDKTVIERLNRIIRGTTQYFVADFTTTRTRFRELDKMIRRRLRCMKYKQISANDNYRFKIKYFDRLGLLTLLGQCRTFSRHMRESPL